MAQTGKTRLQIIIEWLQKNAGLPKAAQAQVFNLGKGMKATVTPVTGINKSMFTLHKNVKNLGFSLGWFGYRLSVMGRMILRSAVGPVKELSNLLKNWDSSMNDVALALALQEAGISQTAMSNEELRETLTRLPEEGLAFQGVMAGLSAVMSDLAIRAGPALQRLFLAIGELMKGIGGEIILAMIHGLANAVEFITALGNRFTWLGPIIGRIMAVLVALSPLFILLGGAMFMLGPMFIAAQLGFAAIFAKILLVIAAVGVLITFWGDLVRAIRGGWEWVQRLLGIAPGTRGATTAAGAGRQLLGAGGGSETTIYQDINVGSISGDIDLARAADQIGNSTADGVSRGQWNPE